MRLMRNDRRSSNGERRLADHYESEWCRVIGCYPVMSIPNPLHPLLPPLPEARRLTLLTDDCPQWDFRLTPNGECVLCGAKCPFEPDNRVMPWYHRRLPQLPPLPEPNPIFTGDPGRYMPGTLDSGPLPVAMQMASDGQVEEKPASGPPRPIETVKEWSHPPLPEDRRCSRKDDLVYTPTDNYPDPCRTCGDDGFISRGVVERDVETGDIYRRDGKAVPRERT